MNRKKGVKNVNTQLFKYRTKGKHLWEVLYILNIMILTHNDISKERGRRQEEGIIHNCTNFSSITDGS